MFVLESNIAFLSAVLNGLAECIENDFELFVVLFFEEIEAQAEIGVFDSHISEIDEGANDLNVYGDSLFALKDA